MNPTPPARRGRPFHPSADLVVVLLLFLALVAFSAYTTTRQAKEEQGARAPTYSTHSTAPDGAAALYLWLEELGYRVARIENGPFRIAPETELLFVLAPRQPFSDIEARLIEIWIEDPGHTLVVVTDGRGAAGLAERFGAAPAPLSEPAGTLTPTVPLLAQPPTGPIQTGARWGLAPAGDDVVVHLQASRVPVLLSRREKGGRLIVSAAARPFTNRGLADAGSARLIYNLIAGLQAGDLVQFDEVHHGYGAPAAGEANDLLGWLRRSPWGWALLYGAAAGLGWILLRGRRFGRPVPRAKQNARRPQGEYVVSMAGLFRRAGRRTFVMRHHHDRLKRELARPWRLHPNLPDEAFVAELGTCHDDLDAPALRTLLAQLSGKRVSESELVRLVGEVDDFLTNQGK